MRRGAWITAGSMAVLAAGLGGAAAVATAQPKPAPACALADIQATAPKDTTIETVEHLDKPVAHCKIEGFVTTTNPGPNKNYFRLQLPDKDLWKGRFFFIGLGGAAGFVPTDAQSPHGNPMLMGFAVAGTDTGHRGAGLDWSFLSDQVKAIDHRDRGGHVTTVAAQAITKAYYGVSRMWRYHAGCSGGGRMTGEAATRHPADYDGYLLGDDGRGARTEVMGSGYYKSVHVAQVMNREPGAWLSPAKLQMIDDKVTRACDKTDGAEDGVVWYREFCHYDVAQLRCKGADGPDCLTGPEITSVKQLLANIRGGDGKVLSAGLPITNMSMWAPFTGTVPPPWVRDASARMGPSIDYTIAYTRGAGFLGPDFDPLKFNLQDPATIAGWEGRLRAPDAYGFYDPPVLTHLEASGGKMIEFVDGSSSSSSNLDTNAAIADLMKKLGPARTARFLALYDIPGVGHCSGGTGPQDAPDALFLALMDWVEKDKPPGRVVSHGGERERFIFAEPAPALPREIAGGKDARAPVGPTRDFLLCPFPQRSVFDKSKAGGPGAVYEAANWSCKPG